MVEQKTCLYVLPMKNRKCRMLVKTGNHFCGEHAIFDSDNERRIPCPLDKKHTILSSQLDQHLKRCNSRLRTDFAWIKQNVNAVKGETKADEKLNFDKDEKQMSLVADILINFDLNTLNITREQAYDENVEAFLSDNLDLGYSKKKHLHQISSIIGHVRNTNALPSNKTDCVVELGAGKAQLFYWLSRAAPFGSYILIDRDGSRLRWDSRAVKENPDLRMVRLRCAIEHIDLSELEYIKESTSILALCKHFCGSATDAGMRSIVMNEVSSDRAVLVPCCHHRSRFDEYTGHEFLSTIGIDNPDDFAVLRYFSSFAINGSGSEFWNETYSTKKLGERAKILLEYGRVDWFNRNGYTAKLIEYIPSSISPENLLIFAEKNK